MFLLKDWNFCTSTVTAIVAIIALFQTSHQTKLSNKQHLFDRRLKAYMQAKGLVKLCKDNYSHLQPQNDEKLFFENDLVFVWLTNNTYMHQQAEVIKHPLEQSYQVEFLKKCEELKCLSEEFQLYFQGKAAMQYSSFISAYENTLFSMYQYQIIRCRMQEENQKYSMTLEEVQNRINESEQRKKLYSSFDNLKKTYDILIDQNADKEIKKQLTLK